ncbi:LytR/AlgR family response regulator transcription factor [Winogradskyella vincentii]|uniref:LytTR family DNA-binding domain-containing protein n=1 Tax=Winogradskyella vincentii TaxID=2877122 RepID=A0ABS7Y0X9_9FLAO|nr:LytTR family DNA-binding domain-containing protein [Winogradskyella vincentii]MCA0153579.1 LytTR family DNA-binding domain-containing protein [Winogradskyella vincentii]
MKAVIIEDEKQAVTALREELNNNCPDVEVCGSATTVKDGYELISEVQPEIVFLDIQLKDGTGFDLLEQLNTKNFKVIFTTAYSKYAIKAIRISALDYLLKPIDSDELTEAVEKAKKIDLAKMQQQLNSLINNRSIDPLRQKIALQTTKGVFMYECSSILRIQSDGNYSKIFLEGDKKEVVAKTLKDFEEILQDSGFLRIHHSHLINLQHLQSYINKDGGYVVLNDKTTLPVSKRKKPMLLKVLSN